MDQKVFLQRIATLDTLAYNKEYDVIPVESISREDQIALREAFKRCKKSDKNAAFILKDCELLCSLGKIAHRLRWFEEAETFFGIAVKKNAQFPNNWYNYGLLRQSQGKYKMAAQMFRNALTFAPLDWDKRNRVIELLGHAELPDSEVNAKIVVPNQNKRQQNNIVQNPVLTNQKRIAPTKTMPKTGKCAVCGTLVGSMAYVCRYCGLEHCQDHRIPEKHNCGPDFRPLPKRQMPTSNEDLVKEIARIGELAANKTYIDISIKMLSDFDEKILKYAYSVLNATGTKAETLSDDFELWFRAGKVAQRLSWPQVAERFYRVALEFGTEVDAWQNLGKVLEVQGKVPEAEDAYRKVTILDPENADAWMRLGNLYEQEGRREDAKVAHNCSFKQDPQKAKEYLENRPWQYFQKLEREEVYQKRIEENEADAEAWFALGILRFIKQELPAAEQAFRTGLKFDPENGEMWNILGCILLEGQQIERGEKCYRQAINVDPENWPAHYNLGLICSQNNRTDAAIKEFQVCSELVPRDVWPWVHLCLLLKSRGRIEESKVAWDKIGALEPWILPLIPDFEKIYHVLKPYRDPSRLYT